MNERGTNGADQEKGRGRQMKSTDASGIPRSGVFFEKETLPPYEERLRTHDAVLVGASKQREYTEEPQTPEERMYNKYATVRRILKDYQIAASRVISPREQSHAPELTRRNLVATIADQQIVNYPEYRNPPYPHIDAQGNIIDDEQAQVITTLVMSENSYYTAPYFTVLKPEALGADTKKPIDGALHQYYLVPEDIDRQEIQARLQERNVPEETMHKIFTFDEFIEQHADALPDDWMHEETKEQKVKERVKERMQFIEGRARMARTWKEGTDHYLEDIRNSDDPAVKETALGSIIYLPNWFYPQPTQEEVVQRGQELFWEIARDTEEPDEVRNMALADIIPNEESVTNMLDLAKNPDESIRIRRHAISKAGRFSDVDAIAQTLTAITRDPEESIEIRHHTLFALRGDHPDVLATYLSYLAEDNEQGQKIAMRKLRDASVLDPDETILDAVNQFADRNTREDTQKYLDDFYQKFDYAIHPERYTYDAPKSWEAFERHLDRSIRDFSSIRREERYALENGLKLYLLQEIRQGNIAVVDIGEGGKEVDDIVICLGQENSIGRIKPNDDLRFGGWGTTVPKEDHRIDYKKIVRTGNTSDSS